MPNDRNIKSSKVEYFSHVCISQNFLKIGRAIIRAVKLDKMSVAISGR